MSDDLRTQKLKEQPHSNGKESVELFLYDEDSRQPHPTDSSIEVITMNLVRVGTVSLIGKPKVLEGDIAHDAAGAAQMRPQRRATGRVHDRAVDLQTRGGCLKALFYLLVALAFLAIVFMNPPPPSSHP